MVISTDTKRCNHCKENKSLGDFGECISYKDGLNIVCRECSSIKGKKYYYANLEENRNKKRRTAQTRIQNGKIAIYRERTLEASSKWHKEYWQNNKDLIKERVRQRVHGIIPEQFNQMLDEQGGVCKICGKPETATRSGAVKTLGVDHDHDTGEIRGLLCQNCNTALGLAQDSSILLGKMTAYLKGFKK